MPPRWHWIQFFPMFSAPEVHFRLSIWRPALLTKSYLYRTQPSDSPDTFGPLEEDQALEQIYSWNAGSNDLLGSAPRDMSSRIQEELIQRFSFQHPPQQRTIRIFSECVTSLLEEPSIQSKEYWTDTQESIALNDEEELNLRANIPLAVLLHLKWISHVFGQVPRASVIIR